jgi:hypothetical protein
LLSRVAPERAGVVVASTRISARQPAIAEYRLAGTSTCARGHASEAAATPEAKSTDAQPYSEVAPDNRPDGPTGTLDEGTCPQAGKEVISSLPVAIVRTSLPRSTNARAIADANKAIAKHHAGEAADRAVKHARYSDA